MEALVVLSWEELDTPTSIQLLDEAGSISEIANHLLKVMHPTILSLAMVNSRSV